VKAGDQVTICYGDVATGNDRMIQDYSFLDPTRFVTTAAAIASGVTTRSGLSTAAKAAWKEALESTTIDEDMRLSRNEPPPDERIAIEFRLGLKRELQGLK